MNHPDPAVSTLESARSALRDGQVRSLLEIVETLPSPHDAGSAAP